jgi:glycosyltransferase involved in cell wall biosynthesis
MKDKNLNQMVSIIIPCFNDGKYLREAVQSVVQHPDQTAYEIIIVNDGSSDSLTLEVLRELEREGFRVIHQGNRGLGAARNTGIKASRGSYILPLDSDNKIRPDYMTAGVRVLESHPRLGVVYSDAEYFGAKTGRWNVAELSFSRLVQGNYIDACAVFRRNAWEEVGGYDEAMPVMGWEDWDFWLRVALKNWGFCHINEVLFDYRVREKSMISKTSQNVGLLCDFIFSKEALMDAKAIRERQLEIARLFYVERSPDYRLGRALLNPLRKMRQLLKGKPAKPRADRPAPR